MIILSLFASMVLTTAAIGLIPEKPIPEEE
jgi:hypothetical protein